MDHVAVEWLVEHTTDVLNKFQYGHDGRTAYVGHKGKKFIGEMYAFATPVSFRSSGKLQGGLMEPRWHQGLWMGKLPSSEEHVVCNLADGLMYRCRSVQPLPRRS